MLYLAVRVRDDLLVVAGAGYGHFDACVVYVDSRHNLEKYATFSLWIQEGKGGVECFLSPSGGIQEQVQIACTRQGNVTIYEWAIRAFDDEPDVLFDDRYDLT